MQKLFIFSLLIMLAACSADATAPTPTAVPPEGQPAAATPLVVDEPPATVAATDDNGQPVIMDGRNEDGTFYRGAVDAPVTVIDYSDFL